MSEEEENRPRSIRLTETELRDVIKESVHETLISLGVDAEHPHEMQADFKHLRDWRESIAEAKSKGFVTLVVIITSGLAGLVWMAVKKTGM